MNLTAFFALLGGLLVLAFAANRLFDRTRVPDVVVLMVAGLILGPGLGLVDPAELHGITRAFGTLAIILILFEGGLELNIRDTLRHSPGGLLFAFLTYVFSFGITTLVAWWSLGLPAASALLVGAVLGCTSIAIIMPVLDQIQVREPVKVTLLLEASLGEVFAVLTVGILLEQMERGGPVLSGVFREFLNEIAVFNSQIVATICLIHISPSVTLKHFDRLLERIKDLEEVIGQSKKPIQTIPPDSLISIVIHIAKLRDIRFQNLAPYLVEKLGKRLARRLVEKEAILQHYGEDAFTIWELLLQKGS